MPEALKAVGLKADYVSNRLKVRKGTKDPDWLPYVGRSGLLLFSCNKAMLDVEAELRIYIAEKVGAVFLTNGQERKADVLRLILNKWDWLEEINRSVERPFAYEITISGRNPRRRDLPALSALTNPPADSAYPVAP